MNSLDIDPSRRSLLAGSLSLGALAASGASLAQGAGDTIRVVSPWEFTSSDPDDTGYLMTRLGVAQTLVQVEPDGTLTGGVCENWSVDADRLTWRFKLRGGALFHDGTPVTAQAVSASVKLAFGGESLSAVPLDAVFAQGEALIIKTKTPFSVLPAFMCDYASIILAPASYGANGKVGRIIATGPYQLARAVGQTALDLERFDTFAGARPGIAKVSYSAVPNGDTRANIAIAGDADLVYTLAPAAAARIDAAGLLKMHSLTIPRVRPIAFNSGLPQFEDARVRRAISMAIDRAGIASGILRHPASMATQLLPPSMSDWHNKALPPIAYDPAAARKLLEDAGWIAGADGVRIKGGVRLAAKMTTISNRPELPVMSTAIQGQLKQIGMEITIEAGPSSGIPAAIKDGTMQMTMFARTYVNVPEVIATIIPDYTRERSNWGTMNWPGRTRMKVLTDEYVASFDETRKGALRADITKFIYEDAPIIPVSWFEHNVAVSARMRGLVIDPYETRYLVERMGVA